MYSSSSVDWLNILSKLQPIKPDWTITVNWLTAPSSPLTWPTTSLWILLLSPVFSPSPASVMYLRVSVVTMTELLLLLSTHLATSYPFGAPACVSSPRHGLAPQTSQLDIYLEKNLTEYGDVRLQLGHPQSDFTFRGFLVMTKAPGRKWLSVMFLIVWPLVRRRVSGGEGQSDHR